MNNTINTYLGSLHIGSNRHTKTCPCTRSSARRGLNLDYLLLDEALAGNVIEIAEVNQGGSVPELKVVNKAGKWSCCLTVKSWWAPSRTGSLTPRF